MILGYHVIPCLLTSGQDTLESYDKVEYMGEAIYDEIQTYGIIKLMSELFDHAKTAEAVWDDDTILLDKFNNNLDGGNFPTNGNPVTNWRILRRRVGETEYILLATITNLGINSFYDIYAEAGIEYEYAIQSVSSGTRGDIINSEVVSVTFWGWIIQDEDYNPLNQIGQSFQIFTELNVSPIKNVGDRAKYLNYNQFPTIRNGIRKYWEGSVGGMLIESENNVCVLGSNSLRERFVDFLLDTKRKVLKNGSGLTMIVSIDPSTVVFDYDKLKTNPGVNEQPFAIEFSYDEVARV
jgi:hypothetical protein